MKGLLFKHAASILHGFPFIPPPSSFVSENAMPPAKRFRVLLEKYETSQATGIKIPFDVHKVFGTRARVPVRGKINGFAFRSSIFPVGDGHHFMVVNKVTREGARAAGGEMISVLMERDDEPRMVTPPPEFARALKANEEAQAMWDKLAYTHRKKHATAIEEAKRPETRARRIEKAIAQIVAGEKP